jgi:hypothetical protein
MADTRAPLSQHTSPTLLCTPSMTAPLLQQLQQSTSNTYISPPLPEYVSAEDYHEGLKQIRAHLGRNCGFGIAISRTKSYTPQKTGEKRITRVSGFATE